jgi:hypothetical protein
LELAERQADGRAQVQELEEARRAAYPEGFIWLLQPEAFTVATLGTWTSYWRLESPERAAQANALRDILGSPFRAVTLQLNWLTSDVRLLAHAIYEEHTFDVLPILADALEEAGCTNQDVLSHCRGPGPHVRGCWVVDQILGKG